MGVPVAVDYWALRFSSAGRLVPWLGPALRGVVAGTLKEQVCRYPPAERETQWTTCRGCPYLLECDYGRTYEYDPPETGTATAELRPVTLSPVYPAPDEAVPDEGVVVRAVLIGRGAIASAASLRAAVEQAGQKTGLGPDRIRFRIEAAPAEGIWDAGAHPLEGKALPGSIEASAGVIPRLGVRLTSPLFLRGNGRPIGEPSLDDLFRGALRVVGKVVSVFDRALEGQVDFASLKQAATAVRCVWSEWEPFEQSRWSNRKQQGYVLQGVVGGAVFADVPTALLPWLAWGGRLGVGKNRVAGAGAWQMIVM